MAEQLGENSLERSDDLRLLRRFSNMALQGENAGLGWSEFHWGFVGSTRRACCYQLCQSWFEEFKRG